jgi:hypothetical protein
VSLLDSALARLPDRSGLPIFRFRRFALALAGFTALPSILLAAFVLLVDPYYVFGSPSLPGINVVRPFYELHVIAAKPYQVQRIKPSAVSLGSSRVEVGLDPRHPGWADRNVFNFGLPSATSYEVMLAFLHAQAVGRPLKQAVVGLDFFGFNIFFPRNQEEEEARFTGNGSQAFADFLASELATRAHGGKATAVADRRSDKPAHAQRSRSEATLSPKPAGHSDAPAQPAAEPPETEAWNEAVYLAIHPDVAAAIARHEFKSGREHYELAGRAEGRESGMAPPNWNDALYLKLHPDVAAEVQRGTFLSGYHHYLANGRTEKRESAFVPSDWNEALYLRIYPDVAAEVKRGTFLSGYHHYLIAGKAEGRSSGTPPLGWNDEMYLRFYPDVAQQVRLGTFVNGYHHYLAAGKAEGRSNTTPPSSWNEELYLKIYADVAAEVKRGTFVNGYHHYIAAGKAEGRSDGRPPDDWDELGYLQIHPDVQYHITQGYFISGYHHYLVAGLAEKRITGKPPTGWDETGYLAANPAARARIALGDYRSGYVHYAAVGRKQGLLGGTPPEDAIERLRLHWPRLNRLAFQFGERFRLIFSTTAVRDAILTVSRQSEAPSFDDRGMRIWSEEETTRRSGGIGRLFRAHLVNWRWYLWLMPPRYMYCFTNTETGMSTFDAYRFMLRRAHVEGTDLRLYVTPLNAAVRRLIDALGLGERYEFWLKELVQINQEEAARAQREPFPLWDFSAPTTITSEPIPLPGDLSPMQWYWDFSHYRQATGDLILDRIFSHSDLSHPLPADFGVSLTGKTLDAHLAHAKATLADWSAANAEFVSQMVAAVQSPKAQSRQAQAACW